MDLIWLGCQLDERKDAMGHVSINKAATSIGTEYQTMQDDGVALATTCIKHCANVVLKAIADGIGSEGKSMF